MERGMAAEREKVHCPYFCVPPGFWVLGAFYLDVAARVSVFVSAPPSGSASSIRLPRN